MSFLENLWTRKILKILIQQSPDFGDCWKLFRNVKPYMASHHLDTCSWEVWRKSIQGKWQKWCVIYVTKNNASATNFFTLSPKPIARFRWKRARLSLFRPQPHLPSFSQIQPSFRDLLAETTFQIVTIIGDPIGYRIADNKRKQI